ncbi:hypothetical protein DV965_13380, partial [Staphylococcus pseudintermedius]
VPALSFYMDKLDPLVTEDESVFEQSLKTEKTQYDFVFLVGIENDEVVSFATAHYDATTNVSFLVYRLSEHGNNCAQYLKATIEPIEIDLNQTSNQPHPRM